MGIAVTGDEVLGAMGMTVKHLRGSETWLWHEPVLSFCQQKKQEKNPLNICRHPLPPISFSVRSDQFC